MLDMNKILFILLLLAFASCSVSKNTHSKTTEQEQTLLLDTTKILSSFLLNDSISILIYQKDTIYQDGNAPSIRHRLTEITKQQKQSAKLNSSISSSHSEKTNKQTINETKSNQKTEPTDLKPYLYSLIAILSIIAIFTLIKWLT